MKSYNKYVRKYELTHVKMFTKNLKKKQKQKYSCDGD